jgi:hypothetical protein
MSNVNVLFIVGDPLTWTTAQVGQWLTSIGQTQYVAAFVSTSATGAALAQGLDDDALDILGVTDPQHRKTLSSLVTSLFQSAIGASIC